MKSFKTHLNVIFSLVVLLFSIQASFYLKNIILDYEKKMNDDYSIVVATKKSLDQNELFDKIKDFKSAEMMSVDSILERLKNDMSAANIELLKNSLPMFYSIKLKFFPSIKDMNSVKSTLMNFDGVIKVETFVQTHDKIYKFLKFLEFASYIFSALISLLGLVLIYNQMRICIYEHVQRINIMSLFGAPFWLKGGVLYKISFIDSILSSLIVSFGFVFILHMDITKDTFLKLDISIPQINILQSFSILFAISFLLTIIVTNLIMFKIARH